MIRQQHDGEVLAPGLQVIHKITQNVPVYVFDGFHLAFYYDYASNQNKLFTYKIDGLHNLGFRVGLAF